MQVLQIQLTNKNHFLKCISLPYRGNFRHMCFVGLKSTRLCFEGILDSCPSGKSQT